MSASAPALGEGEHVGDFVVGRLLGRGGMGDVYLARDARLGRRVALKLMRASAATELLHEARAIARLSHPHIVTLYGIGEHAGRAWMALEFLDGESLYTRIARRRMPLAEALRVGRAVGEALAEAHRQGVVHGDLKPANVMLPTDGRPRVVDFGVARLLDELAGDAGPIGTPGYMAPEQWRGAVTAACDVWALGALLFEVCAGRLPFDGPDAAAIARATCNDEAPRLEGVPDGVAELVAGCLARDPAARPSATEAATTLALLLAPTPRADVVLDPFRGLAPFTEVHAHLFFGRDAEVDAVVEALRTSPVVPIVGASGAGKSSFVGAGVVPRLRAADDWLVVRLRPGRQPFRALAEALRGAGLTDDPAGLAAGLAEAPGTLGAVLRAAARMQRRRVLLFVDQLEEALTLAGAPGEVFVDAVCGAADDPAEPVRVIVTARDEFLGRIARSPGGRAALGALYMLHPPGAAALAEILRRPVELCGHRYEDPALVDEMIAEVVDERAGLPLLEFAARSVWEARDRGRRVLTRAAYERMGGVSGALARHAGEVLAEATPGEQRAIRALVLRLVTPEDTRRVLPRDELLAGLGPDGVTALDRLVDRRLLSSRRAEGGVEIELAHESLMHAWPALRRWIDESREGRAALDEVSQAAALWARRGRRETELWAGEALVEVRRALEGVESPPPQVRAFVDAAAGVEARRSRRRRRALMVLVCGLAAVAIGFAVQASRLAEQKQVAERRGDEARAQRAAGLREGAAAAAFRGDPLAARAMVRSALEIEDAPAARALWRRLATEALVWRAGFGGAVYAVDVSPDGQWVAAACQDGVVHLVNTVDRRVAMLRRHADQVASVAFDGQGGVWSGDAAGVIRRWDREARGSTVVTRVDAPVLRLAVDDGGRRLVWASSAGARMFDVERGEAVPIPGVVAARPAVALSRDGRWLAVSRADHRVEVLPVEVMFVEALIGGRAAPRIPVHRASSGHTAPIRSLAFTATGDRLLSVSVDGSARLWDVDADALVWQQAVPDARLAVGALSPDGSRVALGDEHGRLFEWTVAQPAAPPRRIEGHRYRVSSLAYGADAQLASGSFDPDLALWRPERWSTRAAQTPETRSVQTVAFDPTGRHVVTTGGEHRVRVWSVESGRVERSRVFETPESQSALFLPDGRVAVGAGNGLWRWDPWADSVSEPVTAFAPRFALAADAEGRWLVGGTERGQPQLYSTATGEVTPLDAGLEPPARAADITRDGRLVAAADDAGRVAVWQTTDGALRWQAKAPGSLWTLRFSPDGRWLYAAGAAGVVHAWAAESGAAPPFPARHDGFGGRIWDLAVDPSASTHLAIAGVARAVQLRALDTGAARVLRGPHGEVNTVAFSADGRLVAAGGDDHALRLWAVATGDALWRAPVLTPDGVVHSHRGWRRAVDDVEVEPPKAAWAGVPRARRVTFAEAVRCVLHDDRVTRWVEARDIALGDAPAVDAIAITDDCLALDADGAVRLVGARDVLDGAMADSPRPLPLDAPVTAMARTAEGFAVVSGRRLLRFDPSGAPRGEPIAVDVGATALAEVGGGWLVGYREGNIERVPGGGRLDDVPVSAVLRLAPGPADTIAAGFADGTVGLWTLNGQRLEHGRLHGPVHHLRFIDARLVAVSDLGDVATWDLRVFEEDRCAVLRAAWGAIPVAWVDGAARQTAPPADHPCHARPGEAPPSRDDAGVDGAAR